MSRAASNKEWSGEGFCILPEGRADRAEDSQGVAGVGAFRVRSTQTVTVTGKQKGWSSASGAPVRGSSRQMSQW